MYRHDYSSIMFLTGVCTVSSYSLSVDPYNNSSPFCQRAFIPFSSDSDASFSHREKLAQATVTKVLVSKSTSKHLTTFMLCVTHVFSKQKLAKLASVSLMLLLLHLAGFDLKCAGGVQPIPELRFFPVTGVQ